MKVVLPMAGSGSRFKKKGESIPKPLIQTGGKPLFWWALQSIKNIKYSELIIIALDTHDKTYNLKRVFNKLGYKNVTFVFLDDVTEGQLCTVLAAKNIINNEEDILITNSDTFVISEIGKDIENKSEKCHGIISVANVVGDQWSFARTDQNGKVIEVAEKNRISNNASTGIYYFSEGIRFVEFAEKIIANKQKTKGEYYIMPLYQKYIDNGLKINISKATKMWDLGTPDNLSKFTKIYLNGLSVIS
jgi:UDP-N-acetylglucosamine diphosphorylase / glucose-1-phosphate thymidylyltransferase / UDP-N-acetylgalactosamine diphosphorylase / glucosamine-1-phosphate N-acetyltransferase / galactosamine-1-phosphate N-acetyltransferase